MFCWMDRYNLITVLNLEVKRKNDISDKWKFWLDMFGEMEHFGTYWIKME